MYAPSGDDRYKVYIVDEAHMLTREAWNALLKILEEPPPRVVFVFATTEPQKIAQAAAPVLSRLQRFDFKRIGPRRDQRAPRRPCSRRRVDRAEPQALAMIARAADGSMRDALSLTDQVLAMGDGHVTRERVRDALGLVPEDEFLALLDLILERRAGDVFTFVGRLADAGIDFALFLSGFADMLRAQLAILLGGDVPDLPDRASALHWPRSVRSRWAAADLLRMLSAIGELEPRFRKSGQQQLLVETLLVRFALLDRTVEIEDLLARADGRAAVKRPRRGRRQAPSRSSGHHARRPSSRHPKPVADDVAGRAERVAPNETPVPTSRRRRSPTSPPQRELRSTTPLGGAPSRSRSSRVAGRWDDLVAQDSRATANADARIGTRARASGGRAPPPATHDRARRA